MWISESGVTALCSSYLVHVFLTGTSTVSVKQVGILIGPRTLEQGTTWIWHGHEVTLGTCGLPQGSTMASCVSPCNEAFQVQVAPKLPGLGVFQKQVALRVSCNNGFGDKTLGQAMLVLKTMISSEIRCHFYSN
jgi:hypothetical protein